MKTAEAHSSAFDVKVWLLLVENLQLLKNSLDFGPPCTRAGRVEFNCGC